MVTKSSEAERGLIVGAGIAGPALAIALRRVGIEADVFESSAVPHDRGGAFLNIAPNGLKVLAALGLERRIEGLGFVSDRVVFENDRGRALTEAPVGGVTLLRGELSRALREAATEAGVRFVFGKKLESLQERGGAVVAAFANTAAEYRPFVVGADGIHSPVRSAMLPDAPAPTYAGVLNLGGVVHTDLAPTGRVVHMVFGRRAFFGYAVRPSGQTYWFSNYASNEQPEPDDPTLVEAGRYRDALLELHEQDPPEIRRILDAVRGHIGVYPVYDVPSLPSWHEGSVCLVGDAAHAVGPHVGQGASLALEDAFVLAKCMRDLATPSAAFAVFEALRRERVERVSRETRTTGSRKTPSSVIGRTFRDLVLPHALRRGVRATEWMYSYPVDWEERVASSHPVRAVSRF